MSGRVFLPSRALASTEAMSSAIRSHGVATMVVAYAELLSGTGSKVDASTTAELVRTPTVFAVTIIVIESLAPLAKLPKLQVTVPGALLQPGEAETKATPSGNVSVTMMSSA